MTVYADGCGKAFCAKLASLGLDRRESPEADIAVIGENPGGNAVSGNLVFCPDGQSAGIYGCVSAVSAGMSTKATLGFSSVGNENALLAVNREIDFFGKRIEQQEIRTEIDSSMSGYENMIFGFLNHFL